MLFVRNTDAQGWELHLRDPESSGNHTEYLSHGHSFMQTCKAGELDYVKGVEESSQVDLEASDEYGLTPLHWAASNGHLPVVQYLYEQGADKEPRSTHGSTPLRLVVFKGHLFVLQYLCVICCVNRSATHLCERSC